MFAKGRSEKMAFVFEFVFDTREMEYWPNFSTTDSCTNDDERFFKVLGFNNLRIKP